MNSHPVAPIRTKFSRFRLPVFAALSLVLASAVAAAQQPDIIIADFEGDDYGTWVAEGTAFGKGPARGSLEHQMKVEGFRGKGLVNSFVGTDAGLGTLTSPEFKIDRRYVNFLIGGGGFAGKTEMQLLIDGKPVRTATGTNTRSGGSEALDPSHWDVAEFAGKAARIRIVDQATGTWGHINVDHIVQTDTKPPVAAPGSRELVLEKRYLLLPVKSGEGRNVQSLRMSVVVDGKPVREFDIELSDEPTWFAHVDVADWRGKRAVLQTSKSLVAGKALEQVKQDDAIWNASELYREPLRPQLHFSPRRGWVNDPNGMVFANGEYHLYFQHNPYGWNWGNMHWGHAVSRDLVHWEELPIALYPHQFGDWAFSGSAVVDKHNTSGWKRAGNDLLVGAYTSTGRGECIIYSRDLGRTWKEYEGNPVVKHNGRDPRLLWHEASRQWVMALYSENPAEKEKSRQQVITFHTSPDLKQWTYRSTVPGFYECPDIFELPVDGDASKKKWVLTGASSEYMVGSFDGTTFTPETPMLPGHRGSGFYAAQTFTNEPKGRVIQMGWMRAASPGMAFNQAMSFPLELSLRSTDDWPRLSWKPAAELAALRGKSHRGEAQTLKPDAPVKFPAFTSELLEIHAEFEPAAGSVVTLNARGIPLVYHTNKQELQIHNHRVSVPLRKGRVNLTIFTDRTFYEVFAEGGLLYAPVPAIPKAGDLTLEVSTAGGSAKLHSLEVHELKSIW